MDLDCDSSSQRRRQDNKREPENRSMTTEDRAVGMMSNRMVFKQMFIR